MSLLSSSSGERSETGGPSGARERETVAAFRPKYLDGGGIAFGAAGSPGLRRKRLAGG